MNKFILLIFIFISVATNADIHFTTNGKIVDPGMYWAILAREEFNDIKEGKGNKKDLIRFLQLSASYGFNPSRFGIGVVYANGQYNVKKDQPRALAWLDLAANGSKDKEMTEYRDQFKLLLTDSQIFQANAIQKEIESEYGNKAAFNKFKSWMDDEMTLTGSRIKGTHSYLTITKKLGNGNDMQAFELFNRLNHLLDLQLENQDTEVVPHEIEIVNDQDSE